MPSSASSSTAADSSPLASTSASAFASSSSTRPSTSSSARTPFAASASSSSYPSLSPTPIHEALSSNPRFDAMRRGTQEDAEEFLGFFLETLSEEVAEIVKKEEERIEKLASASSTAASAAGGKNGGKDGKGKKRQEEYDEPIEEEEGWEEVGSKGRTATTRTVSRFILPRIGIVLAHVTDDIAASRNRSQTGDMKESPITKIFGGKSRSVLRCPGQKDSVTIEPFQRLQLDIQASLAFAPLTPAMWTRSTHPLCLACAAGPRENDRRRAAQLDDARASTRLLDATRHDHAGRDEAVHARRAPARLDPAPQAVPVRRARRESKVHQEDWVRDALAHRRKGHESRETELGRGCRQRQGQRGGPLRVVWR